MSKNNAKMVQRKMADQKQKFGIRKLSVGVASVLLGTVFYMQGSTVHADVNPTMSVGNDTANVINENSGISSSAVTLSTSNSASSANSVSSVVSASDVTNSIATSQTSGFSIESVTSQVSNSVSAVSEQGSAASTSQVNAGVGNVIDSDNTNVTSSLASVQNNQVSVSAENASNEQARSNSLLSLNQSSNVKPSFLAVSKVVSTGISNNAVNGGFDKATWGTLDVNAWQGSVQGDYYQLTAYTGDANHVIVPNEADFEKAGISTSGKQVGVTSDFMHTIFKDKTTAQDATVAFSKTSNKQVKAIGSDWSNTWGHEADDYTVHNKSPYSKGKLTKFDGSNLDVSNVSNMSYMFDENQISDLTPLKDWQTSNVTDMSHMFQSNQISDLTPLKGWQTGHVTNMSYMFGENHISNLTPLKDWQTSGVTDMWGMFQGNQISDLTSLKGWQTGHVTNMSSMFDENHISNLTPLKDWQTSKVTDMSYMFDNNTSTQTKNLQAKRVINFVYPDGYTGKKQDSVTQTVDLPQKVSITLTTKDSKPSNNVLDWVTKTETPETPAPVYFQDYTVPEIKGLLEPDKSVIASQQADITKPIKVTVTYKLVDSNTNDAFALDSKNGLHEHANVNDNGGYDTDFWGTLDVSKFTTVKNGDNLEITGYTGDASKVIIPNIADFWANGLDQGAKQVTISSSVMHNLAKNATQIGLSKTNNQKVVAGDAIWQDAFGGMTNESNTNSNANGGMWLYNPNLTVMDLHNLDTTNITNMGSMFNDGRNLKVIGDLDNWNISNVTDMSYMFNQASKLANLGDLSKWDTSKVTNMSTMFQRASSLTNIGNLDNWNTSKVTDMNRMFNQAFALTSIGDLFKWDVSNVTDMHSMFQLASSLTNIGDLDNWNTSNVTDMSYMFNQASKLANVGDLSKWDTAKVTDMSTMFQLASSLTNIGDLDNWNTSKVTDMSYMFSDASKLTNIGDLSKWDVSNVITMRAMFQLASSLTSIGDLDNWNTSKVIDMSHMFSKASKLQNLGNLDDWNISKVTDMSYMFNRASALTNVGDLSKWDTAKVTDMSVMFYGMTALKQLNISNWNLTKLTDKGAFQFFVTGDSNLVVIANNVQLPTWYQNELSNSNSYWNDHLAIITNNETLLKATGSVDNVTVDDASVTRSVFYNSNGSDDAVSVLKQANQAYVKQYQSKHPGYSLTLALDVDQTDPIALANSKFISSKVPQTFKINFVDDTNGQIVASSSVEHVLVDTTLTLDTKELIKLIPEYYYFTDGSYSIPTSFNYQYVTDNLTIHLTKAPVYTFNLVDDTLGKTASTLVWDGIDSNYHLTGTVSDLNQKIKQAVNAVEWKNVSAGAQHGDVPKSANLLTTVTDLTTLPTQDTTQTVHFVHATHSINEAHDVSQVIHYVYQNGSKALDDHVDSVHFVRDGYHDEFDNTDHWNSWTPSATYDFVAVQSPKVQGFTPDIQIVDKATVNPSSQNIEQTVTYNPDAQKAVVKYIDDTDQKQLSVEDLTGHSDGDSGYNTKASIDQYLAKHYVLVSDDTHGQNVIYDHDDNTNQVYEVHFKHGTEPVSESRTKNLIVHYVYADGLARSGQASTDQKSQSLTFKRTGTKDLVTNNIAWNAWDHAGQTFDEIKSPIIDGYIPDQASIKDVQVNADGLELTEKTVVYNADSQKLMVNFIDDVTGKTLETINKVGQSDESANYDTKSDISK